MIVNFTGTLGSVSTSIIGTDQDNLKDIEVASGPTHIFSVLLQGKDIGVRILDFVVLFGMSNFEFRRQDYTCMSLACISLYGNGRFHCVEKA